MKLKKLPLSHGQFALVDDEGPEWLYAKKWYAARAGGDGHFIARRSLSNEERDMQPPPEVILARAIIRAQGIEIPAGMMVDHISGNTLDCRKESLRVCGRKELLAGRREAARGRRGVRKSTYGYEACIRYQGVLLEVGEFQSAQEAALAYDKAAIIGLSKSAWTNFDYSEEQREAIKAEGIYNGKGSRYRGVSRNFDRWQAQIKVNGQNYHLGFFESEEAARIAYDLAALRLGQPARVNDKELLDKRLSGAEIEWLERINRSLQTRRTKMRLLRPVSFKLKDMKF